MPVKAVVSMRASLAPFRCVEEKGVGPGVLVVGEAHVSGPHVCVVQNSFVLPLSQPLLLFPVPFRIRVGGVELSSDRVAHVGHVSNLKRVGPYGVLAGKVVGKTGTLL